MATEVKYALRTKDGWDSDKTNMEAIYGAGPGPDGDGNFFTSVYLWEGAIPPNISDTDGTGESWRLECFNDFAGGAETNNVSFTSRTVDPDNVIQLTSADGSGLLGQNYHNGVPKSGVYLQSSLSSRILGLTKYVEITRIELRKYGSADGHMLVCGGSTHLEGIKTNDLIFAYDSTYTGNIQYCIERVHSYQEMHNCLFINESPVKAGLAISLNSYARGTYYNLVVVNFDTAFQFSWPDGNSYANCVAYNCNTSFNTTNTPRVDTCNNAASDGATVTPPGDDPLTVDIDSTDFANVSINDYHLSSTSRLHEAGRNFIENPMINQPGVTSPAYDIDGDQWPEIGAWDIGVDYFVGGPVDPPVIASGNSVEFLGTQSAGHQVVANNEDVYSGLKIFIVEISGLTQGSVTVGLGTGGSPGNNFIANGTYTFYQNATDQPIIVEDYAANGNRFIGTVTINSINPAPSGLIYNDVVPSDWVLE